MDCRTKSQKNNQVKYHLIIGIDPGVTTGLAVWSSVERELIIATSGQRCQIESHIKHFAMNNSIFVRFEDARLRTWFGQSGKEKLQGAGSIKRDSQLWEEWLIHHNIPFEKVAPKNNRTKISATSFNKITQYPKKTNEHARDAAMLVYKFNQI
jgi:hypothetical protein